jgi:transketolase
MGDGVMNDKNFRKVIIDALIPYAQADDKIVLLIGDMGFGAVDHFQALLPKRTLNLGMMEQGMVGIAAGMAMSGLKPIIYTMVNFLAFRAIEQIRNDVIHQGLNVKFIGTGADDYFKFLGISHCCGKDDVSIMKMIGMPVIDPYGTENCDFQDMIKDWITSKETSYIRV